VTAARRDLVVIACAVSAGIHAALVPEHLEHGAPAGLGFAVSAVLLAGIGAALARRPSSRLFDAAAVLLGGLIAAYALAATTAIPILHPHPEPVDGLGVATKAVEALGLLAALNLKGALSWTRPIQRARSLSR
jgi:drug/metabolite transporter (DMT)-like permease